MTSTERIIAGEIVDSAIRFRFRVLAYRKMSDTEIRSHFLDWYHNQRDKRTTLKNKTITLVADFGMLGGFF